MINKFINFIQENNSVIIQNQNEFERLNFLLKNVGLKIQKDFSYWKHIYLINERKETDFLIFEYSASKEGFTFLSNINNSIEWYGQVPYSILELEESF